MQYGVVLPHIGPYAREHVVERVQTVAGVGQEIAALFHQAGNRRL